VHFKESEMASFISKISKVVNQQKEDVRAALLNRGPYTLTPQYLKYLVPQDKWFKMMVKQSETHIKKFETDKDKQEYPGTEEEETPTASLTVSAEQAELSTIPLESLKNISGKATQLLSKENAVVHAPGNQRAFMVESQIGKQPHYVYAEKTTGKVVCANCPGWASAHLCAHAVAVAEKLQQLEKYITWVKRRAEPLNITKMVTFDTGKGVGRKGNKPSTSRRKGGRSKDKGDATVIVDRLKEHSSTTPQHTQQSSQHNQFNTMPQHIQQYSQHSQFSTMPQHTQQSMQATQSVQHDATAHSAIQPTQSVQHDATAHSAIQPTQSVQHDATAHSAIQPPQSVPHDATAHSAI
jgi:hypothetical protein